ncbi:MAG TPA: hypothetical protein VFU35_02355 [Jatrophihabitans sp.]|nr:hypothetical protein [Jatrophihabitans sp.]
MGTPLDSGKYLAEGALIAASAATCVIPAGCLLVSELYMMQSDPGAQFEAGQAWLEVGEHLNKAISAAESINNAVGGAWRDDPAQTAFSEKLADYIRELMVGMVFAYTVGVALIVSAIALFILIVIGAVMALGLTIWAAAVLAAIASVVGNLGASEALEAEATTYALDCYNGLKEAGEAMRILDLSLAGGITALLVGDTVTQFAMGDHDAFTDLAQATVDGLGTITAGLVAALYQRGVGKLIKAPGAGAAGTRIFGTALGLTDTTTGDSLVDDTTGLFDKTPRG